MSKFSEHDKVCMTAAIAEAACAAKDGKMPFGAVLGDARGEIIFRAHNQCNQAKKRGGGMGDVTRHAEMELIRDFTTLLPVDERSSCTLYTSTEPCCMCAGAIFWSGVGRVVFGCSVKQLEVVSGPGGFDVPLAKLYGMAAHGARKIDVQGPFFAEEALKVHKDSGVWKYSPMHAADHDIAVESSLKVTDLGSAEVREDNVVPTIDLSKGTDEEIRQLLWDAATKLGFFTVIGHGIDQSLIDDAFAKSQHFFSQPLEEKKMQSPDMTINCGFENFSQVRPSTGVADQKESLQVTARKGCMDGRWPSEDFKATTVSLLDAANSLAGRLLDLLESLATPQVKKGTLSGSHTLWGDDGQCTLRYLHYPAMENSTVKSLLEDGYWRAGPHTDWDNLTLLFQHMDGKGLECCANPRTGNPKEMYWTTVNPIEGGIAVNIGDMLARWSDGKLHSNLHRVRLPVDASKPRYSIAFFAQSDKKTLIESKDSDPISAGEYILSRIRSNFTR
jgi:isopenicillin N synthase-like dioxygenase/tRNA(Arg) A34 adenosine deaminase TadA